MPVVPVVTDVTDVPVFPSSVVTEVCDGFLLGADWEFVEPQPFSFSMKSGGVWTATQEEMRYESSPAKAPPLSRRRTMPQSKWSTRFGMHVTERFAVPGRK